MAWRVAAKLLVSGALIAWLLSRTALSEIGACLAALDTGAFAISLVLAMASWCLSALRLWLLMPEYPFAPIARMTLVGLYYGTVLPGQVAGDLVKAWRLSHAQASPGRALAATVADRVVAAFALLLVGSVAGCWLEGPARKLALAMAVIAAIVLVGLAVSLRPRVHAFAARWLAERPGNRLFETFGRFNLGLELVVSQRRLVFANFVAALVFHALCVTIHVVLGPALGIDLSIGAWTLVYAGVSVLTLLPISVAGLGLREGGYVGLLGLFGVGAAQALSLSLIIFALVLIGALLGAAIDLMGPPIERREARG